NSANAPYPAFIWTSAAGKLDIGTLGGTHSIAYDINSTGHVVGTSELVSGASRAFIWHDDDGDGVADPGEMKDLNTLTPPSSNWTLQEARSINNGGQIVGFGLNPSGETHAFLLTPDNFVPS